MEECSTYLDCRRQRLGDRQFYGLELLVLMPFDRCQYRCRWEHWNACPMLRRIAHLFFVRR